MISPRPLYGLALLFLIGTAPAQVASFREDFVHTGNFGWWGTNPGSTATTTQVQQWTSPNKHWNKVLWDWAPPGGGNNCLLLPDRVAVDPNNQLLLSVPRVAYGSPATTKGSGGEIVSTRQSQYGSYRINMSVSTVTTDFNTGACNSFAVQVPKQGEIEICLYSRVQGVIGINKGVVECILRQFDSAGKVVATRRKSVILGFDPKLAKHTYGFDWHTSSVEFFVDSKVVPGTKVTAAEFAIPKGPGSIRVKHWTGDPKGCGVAPRHWQAQNQGDLFMVVDWVSYTFSAALAYSGESAPRPEEKSVLTRRTERVLARERRTDAIA